MQLIAHIESPFPSKFGVPRQAGLVATEARIVFEPPYRVAEALRGIEAFSHLWLIWLFHQAVREGWSPTVRPPRLGGNRRVGVFASRSPFRPNPIGLSAVRLIGIEETACDGLVLRIEGADLVSGTPILDIKPYLPYADSHPEAIGGFAHERPQQTLQVAIPAHLLPLVPPELLTHLTATLAHDPRPHYHTAPDRLYHLEFATLEVAFRVAGQQLDVVAIDVKNS
ncbi:MAG: tRNA (N6-threonylcarbamoyladenosine(37)-N6)-methyltransferase TrmO [Bacteroidales bacterium]|nr:tRNA (N6-threonylcarbamoyladenosine(37)-N6)-methyltransferase TrmO [Bacteroidales bacterium]